MSSGLPMPARMPGNTPPSRRWAISFADLALLIACTLMLGWRPSGADGAAAAQAAVLAEAPVTAMFVPGEAMLSARGAALLAPVQRAMRDGARVSVTVGVGSSESPRLEAWELAAARTAVIARALGRASGEERVVLAAPMANARVRLVAVR